MEGLISGRLLAACMLCWLKSVAGTLNEIECATMFASFFSFISPLCFPAKLAAPSKPLQWSRFLDSRKEQIVSEMFAASKAEMWSTNEVLFYLQSTDRRLTALLW